MVVWITWPDGDLTLPPLAERPLAALKLQNSHELFLFVQFVKLRERIPYRLKYMYLHFLKRFKTEKQGKELFAVTREEKKSDSKDIASNSR